MVCLERLDADSSLRTHCMLDELLHGYAASYGLAVDEETRQNVLQICEQRFGSTFISLNTSCPTSQSKVEQSVVAVCSALAPVSPTASQLQRHIEPLLAISIEHLRPETRQALANDALSTHAYPNEYGGFIYVGMSTPKEPELAAIFEAVRCIDVVWIKFDVDAEVVEGFPTFDL